MMLVAVLVAALAAAGPPGAAGAAAATRPYLGKAPSMANDPSTSTVAALVSNVLNRYGTSSGDALRPQDLSGNNPVDDNFRRGSFGPRRRRVPYGEVDEQLSSVNPYHQFNNARNLPMDVFKPRARPGEGADLPFDASLGDYAKRSRAFSLPYGGFSSFRNHIFRRATADPLFRMKLHRSAAGLDPKGPLGAGVEPVPTAVTHPTLPPLTAYPQALPPGGAPRVGGEAPIGAPYFHPYAAYGAAGGVYSSGPLYSPAHPYFYGGAALAAPVSPEAQASYLSRFGRVPGPAGLVVHPYAYHHNHLNPLWLSARHPAAAAATSGNPFAAGIRDSNYMEPGHGRGSAAGAGPDGPQANAGAPGSVRRAAEPTDGGAEPTEADVARADADAATAAAADEK